MRYSIFKLMDMLTHKFRFLLASVNKHAHGKRIIILEGIEIDLVRVPETRAEDHEI